MKVHVDDCDNCPLCSEGAFCQHPGKPAHESQIWEANESAYEHDTAFHPPWCPLRAEPLLIQLRTK